MIGYLVHRLARRDASVARHAGIRSQKGPDVTMIAARNSPRVIRASSNARRLVSGRLAQTAAVWDLRVPEGVFSGPVWSRVCSASSCHFTSVLTAWVNWNSSPPAPIAGRPFLLRVFLPVFDAQAGRRAARVQFPPCRRGPDDRPFPSLSQAPAGRPLRRHEPGLAGGWRRATSGSLTTCEASTSSMSALSNSGRNFSSASMVVG